MNNYKNIVVSKQTLTLVDGHHEARSNWELYAFEFDSSFRVQVVLDLSAVGEFVAIQTKSLSLSMAGDVFAYQGVFLYMRGYISYIFYHIKTNHHFNYAHSRSIA
jgi:hypothetical protein